ncbi:MAG: hypothetical protein HKN50_12000 [Gammaproteobacteria bacterium]|nr:hypothetical protein [Gammaproteobacteria bacterium]
MDRTLTFLSIGVVFWVVAAIFMHYVGPLVFDGGVQHAVFWLLNFLLPVAVLPLIARFTDRTRHQMLAPTCLIVLPAMTLDGIAISLDTLGLTHAYANTPWLAGVTGGFLLFAFASFLFWAIVWQE